MSSEWQTYYIKDMGKVVTGKTPSTSKNEYFNGDIPFLTPTDMKDGCKTVIASRSLTNEGLKTVKNCLIPKGVAVSCIGWQMGKAVLVLEPTVTNQQINTIVVDETRFDLSFIYYSLSSMREKIFQYGATATRTPIVNKSSFENFTIVAPSLKTQKEISKLFSTIDDRIALLRETNTTLESIAQALFKSWFVDFDPVHANAGTQAPSLPPETQSLFPSTFVESPLGLVPEGWGVIPIYNLANYINGAAYKAFEPNAERRGFPIIKIAELKGGVTAQTAYSDVEMNEKYRIDNKEVLFSWSGNPDTSIDTFVWPHGKAWLNQHIFKVVPHAAYDRSFVLLMLKYLNPAFAEIARDKQTTGLGHVTVADLKRLNIAKSSNEILFAWNEIVDPIIERSYLVMQKANTLSQLRDTLLPRLISGQLRLPEIQELAEGLA